MAVADGVGVYTPNDYAAILEYLCDLWQVRLKE
jgi:isopropylmalate/homocitrate/citramalate synthase